MTIQPEDLVQPWIAHAKARPQDLAIQELGYDSRAWTWSDLEEAAQAYQYLLLDAGVRPGARVALCDAGSAQWVAMVWACWSIRAVWCALPPTLPAQRFQALLEHLDPAAIWQDNHILRRDAQLGRCHEDAAYIAYTSGSSGQPKGVLVGAQGLPTLWKEQAQAFATHEKTRAAWMLSPAFDASVSDVGVALTAGATLFPVQAGRWKRWKQFQADVETFQIDQVDAPPAWLALWAKQDPPAHLATVIAGGETTDPRILDAWAGQLRWINVYGPTEASVCTSLERRRPGDRDATLGKPLTGITYRIGREGVPDARVSRGELMIGGQAVAIGYWRDPMRSSQRFLIHQGQRWFRTGDLVRRYGNDWHFEGRIDRQVKLRGQLLHLDEPEAVLLSCPGVNQAAAFVDDKQQLVMAVPIEAPSEDTLRLWAKERLPAWGVPQRWIRVKNWPLTESGKTDYQQLKLS